MVLEKTFESPLDCKDIQPVHSKGDQSSVFFGRTDAKAKTPILLPPHAKSWLIGKDSDAGRDWGQEEKGTTEDEMAGWHHQLNGHEFEWTPRAGDGQGGLACCNSWGHRVGHDWATELNWSTWSGNQNMNRPPLLRVDLDLVGLSTWHSGKESTCQCRRHKRHGFDSWAQKIPGERKWQPAPVFFPEKFHGQRNLAGYSP